MSQTVLREFILLVTMFSSLHSSFLSVLAVMELRDRELCDALKEGTVFDVCDFRRYL